MHQQDSKEEEECKEPRISFHQDRRGKQIFKGRHHETEWRSSSDSDHVAILINLIMTSGWLRNGSWSDLGFGHFLIQLLIPKRSYWSFTSGWRYGNRKSWFVIDKYGKTWTRFYLITNQLPTFRAFGFPSWTWMKLWIHNDAFCRLKMPTKWFDIKSSFLHDYDDGSDHDDTPPPCTASSSSFFGAVCVIKKGVSQTSWGGLFRFFHSPFFLLMMSCDLSSIFLLPSLLLFFPSFLFYTLAFFLASFSSSWSSASSHFQLGAIELSIYLPLSLLQ